MAKAVKSKVCKSCKKIYSETSQCPLCKGSTSSNVWRGVIQIIDSSKSYVAKKLDIHDNGLFALRVK